MAKRKRRGSESESVVSERGRKSKARADGSYLRVGFLVAVVSGPGHDPDSSHHHLLCPGARCTLTAEGVRVGGEEEEGLHLAIGDGGEGKRRSIVSEVHKVACRNGVRVEGRLVKLFHKMNEWRVVVLLDLLLPTAICINLESWKSGPVTAFAMSHLSCDWERRKRVLECCIDEGDVWNLAECHVLGCALHPNAAASDKKNRFDLVDIFKSLSGRHPADRISSTCIVADDGDELQQQQKVAGLWDVPDDILMSVLSRLRPRELASAAATCKHTRQLASSIIPCMNLHLFPHQRAAVEWMLHRETPRAASPGFKNPLFNDLHTEDGFHFYVNCVTGELSLDMPPDVHDFLGGLFCDEPGLGKTITALSLILKTQGNLPSPPPDAHVYWCEAQSGDRIGYYEVAASAGYQGMSLLKRCVAMKGRRKSPDEAAAPSPSSSRSTPLASRTRRKLSLDSSCTPEAAEDFPSPSSQQSSEAGADIAWVQCDGCRKWRKLSKDSSSFPTEGGTAWFCRMNDQSCSAAEQEWDAKERISSLEGFHSTTSQPGSEQNVSFFTSILKNQANLLTLETRKALNWLADLGPSELLRMASQGLSVPQHLRMTSVTGTVDHDYDKFFQAFGLSAKVDKKKVIKWHYPSGLKAFHFDAAALKTALAKPVEEVSRIYLSKATLVVVPSNLVQHWQAQIQRHTTAKQLRVFVCIDSKSTPMPHGLAWDYDIVITTFNRLSAEWSVRENSLLMQIHWFRIILDEGHTLGASFTLTNKLQMAINMHASRRWVLTGTPTPGTPNSQLVNLHPMLRFLHDELYGSHLKLWDAAISRPFEALCEEGRLRLVHLLERCMISARKADLCTIPPCIRKVKLVDFTHTHATSYNELVETVRRNLLMADWNDPDHVESLLNPRQWKQKTRTLRNVRLSCCVAGQIQVRNVNDDIQETMDMIVECGVDPTSGEYHLIRNSLLFGGNCMRCDEWCRLPILTPCRHFLCLSCVSLDGERCSLTTCGRAYRMQKPKARPENPNPKWPVPQDVIELQPSYVQEDWHPEWQSTSSSKVTYLIQQLELLREEESDQPPPKAIVYSQFLEHISVIESQLTKAGIQHAGMYSPMHYLNKMKALKSFEEDPKCLVLLMDGSSALGLDLSFVNLVYLMEPIWDRSVEEQVVSRAHRMGATRPVFVETLAMSGTIEELMLHISQQHDTSLVNRTHQDGQYLSHLSFVRQNTVEAT